MCFGPQAGGISKEIPATVERGETPDSLGLLVLGETDDKVLRSLSHDVREQPVLLLSDLSEPLIQRVGKLDLSPCHDAFYD